MKGAAGGCARSQTRRAPARVGPGRRAPTAAVTAGTATTRSPDENDGGEGSPEGFPRQPPHCRPGLRGTGTMGGRPRIGARWYPPRTHRAHEPLSAPVGRRPVPPPLYACGKLRLRGLGHLPGGLRGWPSPTRATTRPPAGHPQAPGLGSCVGWTSRSVPPSPLYK